jgi:protein TonB
LEPVVLPPQQTEPKKEVPPENHNQAPVVNIVVPESPAVNFSVPTIGTVVAAANLAVAPPLEPLRAASRISSLFSTGAGGDRPQPPYPQLALQMDEQGTVVILLSGDALGNVLTVEVKTSSNYPVLDRATVDFVKRHWRLPVGSEGGQFQSTITYKIQL